MTDALLDRLRAELAGTRRTTVKYVSLPPEDVAAVIARLEVLLAIAAYDDEDGSQHLRDTGSWGYFDEPGSARMARGAIESNP